MKSVVRSVGSSLGRALVRGILGSLTRRRSELAGLQPVVASSRGGNAAGAISTPE